MIDTLPWLSVTGAFEDRVADGPEDGTVNVTVTPEAGFPARSTTLAASGRAKAVDTEVLWVVRPVAIIVPEDGAALVKVNDAVPVTPAALAVTAYVPATLPAIAPMLASPVGSVTALAADSRAVAPLAGALKLTMAPLTGCPK